MLIASADDTPVVAEVPAVDVMDVDNTPLVAPDPSVAAEGTIGDNTAAFPQFYIMCSALVGSREI